jgi:rubrerythrin
MRAALQSGQMSPEEKKKILKQMDALRDQLSKDKALGDLEKKLAQAMEGLEQSDEQMLEGLQQDLSQLDADAAEGEGLAQALKDLDGLSDALAKGHQKCPSCDKKKEGADG